MKRLLLMSIVLAGCARNPAPEPPLSEWAKAPPVACPTVCAVWRLKLDALLKDQVGGLDAQITCVADPNGRNGAARVIAVDPSDSRVVVVAFDDGCK